VPEPNDGETADCPSKRGPPATLNAQQPLQAAAPATQPTATKSTTSAATINECHRSALAARGQLEHVWKVLERGSSDARHHEPPKGRDNRSADERRPRRTANAEPKPGYDRMGHPKVDRAADRHAPKGVCARMTSRSEEREAGCSQGDTASELGKLDYRALLPSRIRSLAQPVRMRAGRCSLGLPPLQGFLPRGREPAFTGSPLTGFADAQARRP